jgi:hypothetical protein
MKIEYQNGGIRGQAVFYNNPKTGMFNACGLYVDKEFTEKEKVIIDKKKSQFIKLLNRKCDPSDYQIV